MQDLCLDTPQLTIQYFEDFYDLQIIKALSLISESPYYPKILYFSATAINHQNRHTCQNQSKKSFFFSRLSMLSNGEMSSLCCCCCFHYIFFFHAWIPSFTKNCHLVIYHLSKKMVALNSLIPQKTLGQGSTKAMAYSKARKCPTFFPLLDLHI